jgi:hypothetical protein
MISVQKDPISTPTTPLQKKDQQPKRMSETIVERVKKTLLESEEFKNNVKKALEDPSFYSQKPAAPLDNSSVKDITVPVKKSISPSSSLEDKKIQPPQLGREGMWQTVQTFLNQNAASLFFWACTLTSVMLTPRLFCAGFVVSMAASALAEKKLYPSWFTAHPRIITIANAVLAGVGTAASVVLTAQYATASYLMCTMPLIGAFNAGYCAYKAYVYYRT